MIESFKWYIPTSSPEGLEKNDICWYYFFGQYDDEHAYGFGYYEPDQIIPFARKGDAILIPWLESHIRSSDLMLTKNDMFKLMNQDSKHELISKIIFDTDWEP